MPILSTNLHGADRAVPRHRRAATAIRRSLHHECSARSFSFSSEPITTQSLLKLLIFWFHCITPHSSVDKESACNAEDPGSLPESGRSPGEGIGHSLQCFWASQAMTPHSSTLAWKIPWMVKPGRLQSMGSLRVGHDWATSLSLFTVMHWGRKWQPTPVFLPGESQGQGSLVGCRLWGRTVRHDWSDLAATAAS